MSRWDRRGSGSRDFEDGEYHRVVAELREYHQGEEHLVRTEDLARLCRVEGRALRAILSEADGHEFVLAWGDSGLYVAESQEDAEPGTRRLESQARRMAERAERRRQFMEQLPQLQPGLF
jgi:hypothetical protein